MIKEEQFHLTTGDLDGFDNLRPYAILDLFQEMAGNHAEDIGVGYETMLNKDYFWIVSKNKYYVHKYPKTSEKVIVRTWPLPPGRADFDRSYQILNLDNELLIEGKSKWCVVEAQSKRIVRSDNIHFNGDYCNDFCNNIEFTKLPLLKKEDLEYRFSFEVRPSSVDHYHNMNNAKYSEIVLDCLELDDAKRIKSMQINYLHESKIGAKLDIYMKREENIIYVYGYLENEVASFQAEVEIE